MVLGAVCVFLLVVVLAQALQGGSKFDQADAEQSTQGSKTAGPEASAGNEPTPAYIRAQADDPLAVGSLDAPVVMVQWTDYRCPFCAYFGRETLPELVKEYVDAGKVRIEFNDVAFFGDESFDAAVAARAAGKQGKFMEFTEALFAAAPESGHPDMPREALLEFATRAGIPDMVQFEADLDSAELAAQVEQSQALATQMGVSSVPFFAIGGQGVPGSLPLESFRELIDAQLAS